MTSLALESSPSPAVAVAAASAVERGVDVIAQYCSFGTEVALAFALMLRERTEVVSILKESSLSGAEARRRRARCCDCAISALISSVRLFALKK